MSQEKALKTLESLGFTHLDARVYVFLAKKGPQKARDLAKCLKIPKQSIYFIIKNLQSDGIVTSTVERPARFSAVPFERVLDLFVNAKMEEAKQIQRNRDEILSDWKSIVLTEIDGITPKFAVLEGRNAIFSKIIEMAQQTNKHLLAMITVPNLVRADQFGFFDATFSKSKERSIQVKLLTEVSKQNIDTVMRILKATPKQGLGLEIRAPDLGLRLSSRMIIKDDYEAILFIDKEADFSAAEKNEVCLWTNCESIVRSFTAVFEDLWVNAIDIKKKIVEIKSGKPSPKTFLIKDAETALKKYDEITSSVQRSIFMITSSLGLGECWKERNKVVEWVQSGVSVKIMAPVTSENFEIANQLSKICELKHVPADYVGTTIIDSQHLFQFNSPTSQMELQHLTSYFENTIYTDDSEFVKKTENMLNDIWKNASTPPTVTLKSIVNASEPTVALSERSRFRKYRKIVGWMEETERGLLTEKDVLEKIMNAKKISVKDPLKDISIAYFSSGMSVIHPPAYLNLPDMIIIARHIDKQSSMGAEDMLAVHLWLETPTGHDYVRAATVGDNPAGVEYRKKLNAGTPAEQYCRLVKEDEIQTRLHGNTFFVGWTAPIPLYPPPFVLPPACLLFEGYGKLKTGIIKTQTPSGHMHVSEFNGFDAFVTFFHPASKYSGPGTDGFLNRDVVMTSYPPK